MPAVNPLWSLPLLLVGLTFAQDPPAPTSPKTPQQSGLVEVNRIAAVVNGSSITMQEVGIMFGPELARLMAEFPRRGPEFERQATAARDRVLQELVDRQLIMGEFHKLEMKGANLPQHAVDQEIKRQVMELYNGSYQKLREELARAHISMASYEKLTRDKMIVQAMRQERFKDVPPSLASEIQAEYNATKDSLRDVTKDVIDFRKIFIPRVDPSDPLSTPETQLELAESIVKELGNGADFGALAKKHSADAFAEEGGLQRDVPRPDLSPEFAAILFDAPIGKTIDHPLEDPAGYTIARVEKIVKGPAPPLNNDLRELMDQRVRARKTSERYDKWIQSLRRKAQVDIKIK